MNPCVQHGAETLEQACIKPNVQIDDPGNGHQWNGKIEGAMTYGEQPQGASSSQGPAERTKQLIGNGFAAVERAESCIAEARAQLASIYNDLSNIPVGPRSVGGSGPEDADAPFNTPISGRAASLTDKTVQPQMARDGCKQSSSRGLKEYSRAVCQKVKQKGRTTYAEVAEELVTERSGQHDDKNVRRRVYDALNVLMAAGMITKDRREIKWNSTGAVEDAQIEQLRTASLQWLDRVHRKQSHLQDLVEQYNRLLALLHRNWSQPQDTVSSNPLMLPFILIQAVVEVRIAEDKGAAHLDFNDMPFQLRDEQHVLKNMQLPPLSGRADLCAPGALQPAPNGVAAMPRPATTAPPAAADTEARLPAE